MYSNEPTPLLLSEVVILWPKTQVCIVNSTVLVILITSWGNNFLKLHYTAYENNEASKYLKQIEGEIYQHVL